MKIDFDVLKGDELYLHTLLSRATGFDTGQHEVDLAATDIAPQYKFRLAEWTVLHPAAEPVVDKPAPPPRNYGEESRAALVKDISETRAVSRLKEWGAAGLEDTKNNAELIRDFVNNSAVKGYWSPELVDVAVANLGPKGSNRLTWKTKEPPAPEPPPEPAEVIGTLPNGEKQLSIDADERTMKAASVKQLLDLNHRRRQASGQMILGKNGQANRVGTNL